MRTTDGFIEQVREESRAIMAAEFRRKPTLTRSELEALYQREREGRIKLHYVLRENAEFPVTSPKRFTVDITVEECE